jgi:hypothetical protein
MYYSSRRVDLRNVGSNLTRSLLGLDHLMPSLPYLLLQLIRKLLQCSKNHSLFPVCLWGLLESKNRITILLGHFGLLFLQFLGLIGRLDLLLIFSSFFTFFYLFCTPYYVNIFLAVTLAIQ